MLRIGDWCVHPASGQIVRDGETVRLEERAMRLLLCLAERAGEVVSIEELLDRVWPGVIVTPDSVYQAVATLRRLLGDDSKQPRYIATAPRLGYRMVAAVAPWTEPAAASIDASPADDSKTATSATIQAPVFGRRRVGFTGVVFARAGVMWVLGAALCLAGGVVFLVHEVAANGTRDASPVVVQQQQSAEPAGSVGSIAVLPFLDLTEGMKEEEFADGMTEELIDKLSKIPGLRVPSPTSSFYFKGKQEPVADIARTLGVTYVLDGSVRKSGATLRVAARLMRASNGYVVWSETYDRPFHDKLMVQDDIASEVAKALRASIETKPGR